jgi:hypothetical protein
MDVAFDDAPIRPIQAQGSAGDVIKLDRHRCVKTSRLKPEIESADASIKADRIEAALGQR